MKNLLYIFLFVSFSGHAQSTLECSKLSDGGSYKNSEKCFSSISGSKTNDSEFQYQRIKNLTRSLQPESLKQAEGLVKTMDVTSDYQSLVQIWIFLAQNNISEAKSFAEKIKTKAKKEDTNKLIEVAEAFMSFKTADLEYALLILNQAESLMKIVNPAWLIQKGNYFRKKGDHGTAMINYNLALDKEQANQLAHYFKGVSYAEIESYPAALGEFNECLKIQNEFPNALREKAEVLFKQGKTQEGKDAYEKYFVYMPDDVYARINYSSSLFANKEYQAAISEADLVLQQKTNNPAAFKLKAYSNFELSNYPEGLENMNQYLTYADTGLITSRDYEYLGKLYQKNGNDSLAISSFMNAVQQPGARSELYSETISLLSKKGKYNDVISIYNQKKQNFTPTSADSYNCGRAHLAIGEYPLADSLFARVCEMQPAWPNGFLMRGNANANMDPGSVEGKAKPHYERYVELAEADTANSAKYKNGLIEAYKYLGYFFYLSKQIDQSKIYWKKVQSLDPADKQAQEVLKQL